MIDLLQHPSVDGARDVPLDDPTDDMDVFGQQLYPADLQPALNSPAEAAEAAYYTSGGLPHSRSMQRLQSAAETGNREPPHGISSASLPGSPRAGSTSQSGDPRLQSTPGSKATSTASDLMPAAHFHQGSGAKVLNLLDTHSTGATAIDDGPTAQAAAALAAGEAAAATDDAPLMEVEAEADAAPAAAASAAPSPSRSSRRHHPTAPVLERVDVDAMAVRSVNQQAAAVAGIGLRNNSTSQDPSPNRHQLLAGNGAIFSSGAELLGPPDEALDPLQQLLETAALQQQLESWHELQKHQQQQGLQRPTSSAGQSGSRHRQQLVKHEQQHDSKEVASNSSRAGSKQQQKSRQRQPQQQHRHILDILYDSMVLPGAPGGSFTSSSGLQQQQQQQYSSVSGAEQLKQSLQQFGSFSSIGHQRASATAGLRQASSSKPPKPATSQLANRLSVDVRAGSATAADGWVASLLQQQQQQLDQDTMEWAADEVSIGSAGAAAMADGLGYPEDQFVCRSGPYGFQTQQQDGTGEGCKRSMRKRTRTAKAVEADEESLYGSSKRRGSSGNGSGSNRSLTGRGSQSSFGEAAAQQRRQRQAQPGSGRAAAAAAAAAARPQASVLAQLQQAAEDMLNSSSYLGGNGAGASSAAGATGSAAGSFLGSFSNIFADLAGGDDYAADGTTGGSQQPGTSTGRAAGGYQTAAAGGGVEGNVVDQSYLPGHEAVGAAGSDRVMAALEDDILLRFSAAANAAAAAAAASGGWSNGAAAAAAAAGGAGLSAVDAAAVAAFASNPSYPARSMSPATAALTAAAAAAASAAGVGNGAGLLQWGSGAPEGSRGGSPGAAGAGYDSQAALAALADHAEQAAAANMLPLAAAAIAGYGVPAAAAAAAAPAGGPRQVNRSTAAGATAGGHKKAKGKGGRKGGSRSGGRARCSDPETSAALAALTALANAAEGVSRFVGDHAKDLDAAAAAAAAQGGAGPHGAQQQWMGNKVVETGSLGPDEEGSRAARGPRAASKFIGVTWRERIQRWEVYVWASSSKRSHYIGAFPTSIHAARAYDVAVLWLMGQDARPRTRLNFPLSDYNLEEIQAEASAVAAMRQLGSHMTASQRGAAAAQAAQAAAKQAAAKVGSVNGGGKLKGRSSSSQALAAAVAAAAGAAAAADNHELASAEAEAEAAAAAAEQALAAAAAGVFDGRLGLGRDMDADDDADDADLAGVHMRGRMLQHEVGDDDGRYDDAAAAASLASEPHPATTVEEAEVAEFLNSFATVASGGAGSSLPHAVPHQRASEDTDEDDVLEGALDALIDAPSLAGRMMSATHQRHLAAVAGAADSAGERAAAHLLGTAQSSTLPVAAEAATAEASAAEDADHHQQSEKHQQLGSSGKVPLRRSFNQPEMLGWQLLRSVGSAAVAGTGGTLLGGSPGPDMAAHVYDLQQRDSDMDTARSHLGHLGQAMQHVDVGAASAGGAAGAPLALHTADVKADLCHSSSGQLLLELAAAACEGGATTD